MKLALRPTRRESEQDSFQLAHQILVLDAFLKDRLDDRRYEAITKAFMDELLTVLDMDALGALAIYPAVDSRAPGWSFIQPITTSHVSAHYFEKPGRMPHLRLDAYSCHFIDSNRLIRVCHEHFALSDWHATFIYRRIDSGSDRVVIDLTGSGAKVSTQCMLSPDMSRPIGGNQCIA